MKIAMVSEHASPLVVPGGADVGGQSVHVDSLARALARRGHEVVVHTRRDDPTLPAHVILAPGVTVHHVDAGPPEQIPRDELLPHLPAFTSELAAHWSRRRPEIVHAHFWMSGVPEGRVEVVPCGVDTAAFRPDPSTPHQPDDLADRPFRVLSLGRLSPRTGVDDAIAMLPLLRGVELVIAGGPAPEALDEDPEARRLAALAEDLGVAERVSIIGGVARDDVPALIRSADAVVCLPWYEPFGIVPLEAMACGRPVIGSGVGGLCDTIDDGRTGLLVPPHSPQAAAAAVRHLMSSPDHRQAMGQDARRRVEEQFDWAMVALATERVYARVVAERRNGALAARVPEQARRGPARGAVLPTPNGAHVKEFVTTASGEEPSWP